MPNATYDSAQLPCTESIFVKTDILEVGVGDWVVGKESEN